MYYFYENGRKFFYDLLDDGMINEESVYCDETITVIDNVEYEILSNSPTPFIYGIKTLCMKVYGDRCDLYNVITGEITINEIFKGFSWLYEIQPFYTTLPAEHQRKCTHLGEDGEMVILPKQGTNS